MQYSKKAILQALLLAPLPLLFLSAFWLVIANREFSLYSISVFIVGHAAVYLAYCILTLPCAFVISLLLARLHWLNIFSMTIFTLLIAGVFFLGLGWAHTGTMPSPWWEIYLEPFGMGLALVIAFSYWIFLIKFKQG